MEQKQIHWSPDEDLILAETVLKYLREGKPVIAAFEECSSKLKDRTPGACGFRWYNTIFHQYKEAVKLARKQGKKLRKQLNNNKSKVEKVEQPMKNNIQNNNENSIQEIKEIQNIETNKEVKENNINENNNKEKEEVTKELLSIDDIINNLMVLKNIENEYKQLKEENQKLKEENQYLKNKVKELENSIQQFNQLVSFIKKFNNE